MSDDPILDRIAAMVGASVVTMDQVEAFSRILQAFGVTCEESAEALRMLPDVPELVDDEPEWYDGLNPWDAHTVSFGDTLERIDGTLAIHEQTTGCHCRQEPDIVMSVCDQCAFQEGNTDG